MTHEEISPIPPTLMNIPAEREAIGGAMLSPIALEEVRDEVCPADFYLPAHQLVWSAVVSLLERGEPTGVMAVTAELSRRGELARAGGPLAAHDLAAACAVPSTAAYFAREVAARAQARRGYHLSLRAAQAFAATGADPGEVADKLATNILDVVSGPSGTAWSSIGELHEMFAPTLVTTDDEDGAALCHWPYLDGRDYMRDLRAGQVVIVAGRPAQGKSTLADDLARDVAFHQQGAALMFGLEMSKREIWERIIAAEAGVLYGNIRDGLCTQDEVARIERLQPAIDAAELLIDDDPNTTLGRIRQVARKAQRKHDLRVIVIDYLQLMTGDKADSREQQVSQMMRGLKILAKQLQVPIVVLSQLNRGPETRQDHKPVMSDLRESGSLEQDADVVILVFREDTYEPETPRAGEADFIVAKHRGGPTGTVTVAFQGHYARFKDMASAPPPPAAEHRPWSPTDILADAGHAQAS